MIVAACCFLIRAGWNYAWVFSGSTNLVSNNSPLYSFLIILLQFVGELVPIFLLML